MLSVLGLLVIPSQDVGIREQWCPEVQGRGGLPLAQLAEPEPTKFADLRSEEYHQALEEKFNSQREERYAYLSAPIP